jgi:hypothetical protein
MAVGPLGAEALAQVLIAHADTDPVLRKKLVMLLASTEGPGKLAAEIDKRITVRPSAGPGHSSTGRSASCWYKNLTICARRSLRAWPRRIVSGQSNCCGIFLASPTLC